MKGEGKETVEQRNVRLEAELSAARKTIKALLDKAERRARSHDGAPGLFRARRSPSDGAGAGVGTGSDAAGSAELSREAGEASEELDRMVKQRNRALLESERQLRRKNAELKQMNEMKAEFISIAAHELRTPLTSIVGYLDLMAEGRFGGLPSEVQRPVASVRRNSHRLMRLVDEMLDVSLIEAGKIVLLRRQTDLAQIGRDVVSELSPLADTKAQSLTLIAEGPVPLEADPDKLHQIISNLVANGIRYTPEEGAIKVTVDLPSEARFAGPWARVRVHDNGLGITEGERSRIFEPFSDVNTAKHHTSSGPGAAGLGLYIARGLVDLHGGIITVESEEGSYTEFTVLLPQRGRPVGKDNA